MTVTTRPRHTSRTLLLDIASGVTLPALLTAGALGWMLGASQPSSALAAPQAAPSAPSTPPPTGSTATLPDDAARFSYGIGFDLGEKVRDGLRTDGQVANLDLLARGFEDALNGRPSMIPRAELDRVLREVHDRMLQRAAAKRYADDPAFKAAADRNAAQSAAAMKTFAADQPTATLDSGVMYKSLAAGPSAGPVVGDQLAVVTYTIYGSDARKIDERTDATIDPGALLPSAARVLRLMRPGDHWLVAIPPEEAFGLGGEPPDIGPNEALIIDVKVRSTAPRSGPAPGTGGGR